MVTAHEKPCHHLDAVDVEIRHHSGELQPFPATHHVAAVVLPKRTSARATYGHHRNPTHLLRHLPAPEPIPKQRGAHHCCPRPPKTAPSARMMKKFGSRCPKGYHANFVLSSSFPLAWNVHRCGEKPVMHPVNTADNLWRALYEPTRELTLNRQLAPSNKCM